MFVAVTVFLISTCVKCIVTEQVWLHLATAQQRLQIQALVLVHAAPAQKSGFLFVALTASTTIMPVCAHANQHVKFTATEPVQQRQTLLQIQTIKAD